jgi:hypothetical protein
MNVGVIDRGTCICKMAGCAEKAVDALRLHSSLFVLGHIEVYSQSAVFPAIHDSGTTVSTNPSMASVSRKRPVRASGHAGCLAGVTSSDKGSAVLGYLVEPYLITEVQNTRSRNGVQRGTAMRMSAHRLTADDQVQKSKRSWANMDGCSTSGAPRSIRKERNQQRSSALPLCLRDL